MRKIIDLKNKEAQMKADKFKKPQVEKMVEFISLEEENTIGKPCVEKLHAQFDVHAELNNLAIKYNDSMYSQFLNNHGKRINENARI